jgi:hypothetical protein
MNNNKNSNALVPTSVSKTCDNYAMPYLSDDTQANSHNLSLNVDVKFDSLNKDEGELLIKPTSRSLRLTAQSVSSVSSNINSVMNEIKKYLTMSNDNTLQATLLLRKNGDVKVFKIHDVKKHGNGNDTLKLRISTRNLHAKGSYAIQSIQLMEDSDSASTEFQPANINIIDIVRAVRTQFFSHFPIINGATPFTDDDQQILHLQNGWWRAGQSQDQPFGGRVWIHTRGEIPPFLRDFRSPGTWNEKTRTLRIWLRSFDEPINREDWTLNQIIIPENLNDAVVNGLRTAIEFRNCSGLACLSVNGSLCGDDRTRDVQWNRCITQRPCWINQIRRWNSRDGSRDEGLNNSLVGLGRPGCCAHRDGNIPPGRICPTNFSDTQCSGGRCRW